MSIREHVDRAFLHVLARALRAGLQHSDARVAAVALILQGRVDAAGAVVAARAETERLAVEPGVRGRLGTQVVRAVRGVGLALEKQLLGRVRYRASTRGGTTETVETAQFSFVVRRTIVFHRIVRQLDKTPQTASEINEPAEVKVRLCDVEVLDCSLLRNARASGRNARVSEEVKRISGLPSGLREV